MTKKIILAVCAFFTVFLLMSCTTKVQKYIIKWENYDGTVLKEDKIKENDIPVYSGVDPVKPATETYEYTFIGWSPEVVPATSNQTYIAQFSAHDRDEIDETVSFEITYTNIILEIDSSGNAFVYAIAEITNTGDMDLFLKHGSIDVEDELGTLVEVLDYVYPYPQIISPGEKAYYYKDAVLDNVPENINLNIVLHPEIFKSKDNKTDFPTTDVELSDTKSWGGIKVTGRVENTSQDECSIEIGIVLFDSNNKPVVVLSLVELSVGAGVKKDFSFNFLTIPENLNVSTISSFITYAFLFQYQYGYK